MIDPTYPRVRNLRDRVGFLRIGVYFLHVRFHTPRVRLFRIEPPPPASQLLASELHPLPDPKIMDIKGEANMARYRDCATWQ